jgi:hypothetical protein
MANVSAQLDLFPQEQVQTLPNVLDTFGQHQGCSPNWYWLKKVFDQCQHDPFLFEDDSNCLRLGVTLRMMQAMKFWAIAFKIVWQGSGGGVYPTPFGEALLSDQGWDCYGEDDASLWLLHWKLLQPPCYAPTWHFLFNHFYQPEFRVDDVDRALAGYAPKIGKGRSASTIKQDRRCLMRMYVEDGQERHIEEELQHPFRRLDLLSPIPSVSKEERSYQFHIGKKKGLSPAILIACCLEYAHTIQPDVRSAPFRQLLYEPGSPGIVFKTSDLYEAVDRFKHPDIKVSRDADFRPVLLYQKNAREIAWKVLNQYYSKEAVSI